ncbi:uncharacterized protein LOC126317009 [Schistocerca gregaria]|uniref:uncharacterized protein LOC126317009 n=1 Tax=Schistocerca gregaria TaxID=7010 RepID=UPI00211DB7A3|nr:uncharacterized protein LOC126317009 [Schistocerca gregaria]
MNHKIFKSIILRTPTVPRSFPPRGLLALAAVAVPLAIYGYNGICNGTHHPPLSAPDPRPPLTPATVEGGHRVIIFNKIFGVREKIFEEGTIWRWPVLEQTIDYDIRMRPRSIGSLTGSKDLQMVKITLRVLYRPDPSKLPTIFRTLGTDFDERVLPSIVNEVSKSVVAQYNASQLIVQREIVSRTIRERLTDRAKDFNLLLGDVSITHLSFGKEYSNAVESKQVAQQEAERAKFIVEKAEQEKLSAIIRATGEAKAAQLIGEAIQSNPNFLTLRKYDTSREIAKLVSNSQNKALLSADILLLNTLGEPTRRTEHQ